MESQRAANELLLTAINVMEHQTNISEISCVSLSLYFGWSARVCFSSHAQLQKEKPPGPQCVPTGLMSVWLPIFTSIASKKYCLYFL